MGIEGTNLKEIRNWDYGILLLDCEECRGVDTIFAKDSLVLITATVSTYH